MHPQAWRPAAKGPHSCPIESPGPPVNFGDKLLTEGFDTADLKEAKVLLDELK